MKRTTLFSFAHIPGFSLITIILCLHLLPVLAGGTNAVPVVTVSSASYETGAIAPGSIVSAFGTQLAQLPDGTGFVAAGDTDPNAPGIQLPKELAGTRVLIGSQQAELLFVSPFQINYIIPTELAAGSYDVKVISADLTESNGKAQVRQAAPSLFTGNADGRGVPAANLLRVRPGGQLIYEPIAESDVVNSRLRPRRIEFGAENEVLYLVLYATGLRGAHDPNNDGNLMESIRVIIGGVELAPDYAGAQGGFIGLDQINLRLPRTLLGKGRTSLSVIAPGGISSNLVEVEFASPAGSAPQVTGFVNNEVLANEIVRISGSGFSPVASENAVRLGALEMTVLSATSSELTVLAPYGAESGEVIVRTPQGESRSSAVLMIRTSISGFVESTDRQPLPGVTVRLKGTRIVSVTNANGAFILPDISAGAAVLEIDAASIQPANSFPKLLIRTNAAARRDNAIIHPIALQKNTGAVINLNGTSENIVSPDGDLTLALPSGAVVTFPDGSTQGTLTLTTVLASRTPVAFPTGLHSARVAQIAPYGTTFSSGGKLTFINEDTYPAGTELKLYRLEQNAGSANAGMFVEIGTATVDASGKTIDTAANAITESGLYFVAAFRSETTVSGRMLESDGRPVRNAMLRARGQVAMTDGNGGFVLRHLPVSAGSATFAIETTLQRAEGSFVRAQRDGLQLLSDAVTWVTPEISLPALLPNQSPQISSFDISNLSVAEGTSQLRGFTLTDADAGQTISACVSGSAFATTEQNAVRIAPGYDDAGSYTIVLTATDNQGRSVSSSLRVTVTDTNRAPSLTVPGDQSTKTGQQLKFTVLATDADAGQIVTISSPSGMPSGATLSNISSGVSEFAWTPDNSQTGTFTVNFRATDNGSPELSETKSVNITVSSSNSAPRITAGAALTRQQGTAASATIATVADDETAAGSLTVTANNIPAGITISDITNNNGTVTANVSAACNAAVGASTVSLSVADAGGLTSSANLTINVTANTAPTLGAYPTTSLMTGQSATITPNAAPADNGSVASVTASVSAGFTGTVSVNPATGIVSIGNAAPVGTFTVTVTATDDCGLQATTSFTLSVAAPNQAPTVNVPDAQSTLTGQALSFTVSGTDPDAGQTVTLSASGMPTGASFNATNGQFSWTPTADQTGSFTVTFTATDNGNPPLNNSKTVAITVTAAPLQMTMFSLAALSGTSVAPDSLVGAFGTSLATASQGASALPLPTSLAGTIVKVKDSTNTERTASLLFVSAQQVNFVMPAGTALGDATVTITNSNGVISTGTINVMTIAPGMFSANQNGSGVALGFVLRYQGGGAPIYQDIARFDAAQNKYVSVPVTLSSDGIANLVLLATGVRKRSSLSAVTVTIGGLSVPVNFVGELPDYPAYDKVQVTLPPSLAGRGEVDVVVTVDGKTANTVKVNLK
jgi:uncharacterized protein (TIGR03437 family)